MLALALMGSATGACSVPPDTEQQLCETFDASVYASTDPVNQSTFVTTSPEEAADLTQEGYTYKELLGPTFQAAAAPGDGLVEVHRLYRAKNHDYLLSADPDEIGTAVQDGGYVDQGGAFYLAAKPSDCLVPVHRYVLRGQHRLAVTDEGAWLDRNGWQDEGVKFYAAPSTFSEVPGPGSSNEASTFSFAVMPDTQLEVTRASDTRLRDRSVWLVENQKRLNLAFVAHVGDIIDRDSPRHEQFQRAVRGLAPLRAAGIPYTVAIGNRDTAATCSEQTRCTDPAAEAQIRDTSAFNRYFHREDFTTLKGQFERGKLDNEYALYKAGGLQWMVLTLELWPRPEAVQWANRVVAAHPDANVIVNTHSYLDPSGEIRQTDGGYGDTSPQYLFDHLIKRHENIKLVLSGHQGAAVHRVDKGIHGNRIYSLLQTFHDVKGNPTRLVQVNPSAGTMTTWIYTVNSDRETPGTRVKLTNLDFVR